MSVFGVVLNAVFMSWGVWKATRIPLPRRSKKKKTLHKLSLSKCLVWHSCIGKWSAVLTQMKDSEVAVVEPHNKSSVSVLNPSFILFFFSFCHQNKLFACSSIQMVLSDDKADSQPQRQQLHSLFKSALSLWGIWQISLCFPGIVLIWNKQPLRLNTAA